MSDENKEDFNNLDNYELQKNSSHYSKTEIVLVITILILSIMLITGIILYYFIFKKNEFKLIEEIKEDNYSFKAEYYNNQDNILIKLINETYLDVILELIIDGIRINKPCANYTFYTKGFHTAYFLMDISNLTSFRSMFNLIEDMTSIQFSPLFNTENITDMTSMFASTKSLTSIDISNFNTEKVKSTYYMFSFMSNLKSIDIAF